jgi:putative hemolysin
MVDREEVITLAATMSLNDAFLAAHVHRHTRYPLLDNNDWSQVLGYINFKDIVTALHVAPENPTVKGICRPVMFVQEDAVVSVVMRRMIREHQHIAVVKNANQEGVGVVTLEDVIEALVGDIEDEYDRPPEMAISLAENRWRIGGGVSLAKVKERIFRDLPETQGTVDELVRVSLGGKDLKENYQFMFHGISIRVRRIARDYVYDVIAERKAPPASSPGA